MRKNKFITALLAAIMITAAFLMPITAYANDEPGDPVITFDIEGLDGLELVELLEAFTIAELIEMFGSMDFTGFDISDFDSFFNEEPSEESAIPDNLARRSGFCFGFSL